MSDDELTDAALNGLPDMSAEDEAMILACVDLGDRTGAREFVIGYDEGDEIDRTATWYAHVKFNGVRINVSGLESPVAAAEALAARLLRGATCKCGKYVTLRVQSDKQFCRWQVVGQRWESSCDAPSIHMPEGSRGDVGKLDAAMENRRQRRARAKDERRGKGERR